MIWFVIGCILGVFVGVVVVGAIFAMAIQYGIGKGLGW